MNRAMRAVKVVKCLILDDIDENDEEKEEAKKQKEASKKLLDDIEKRATSNRPNPLKKRDPEGNIIDRSDPDRKPRRDPFDESLLKYSSKNPFRCHHCRLLFTKCLNVS